MKSSTLVITLVLLILIFLGIFGLTYNRGCKEGATGMETLGAGMGDMLNTVQTQLRAQGVDTTALNAAIPGALQQITDLITPPTTGAGAGAGTGATTTATGSPDLSHIVDSTGDDYFYGDTFFNGSRFSDGFCQTYSDPTTRDAQCGALTTENCNQTDCCVVLNGSKCVAGDADGPTFQKDEKGQDIDFSYFSYKNNCYGTCGGGVNRAINPCDDYEDTDTMLNERCIKRLWSEAGCTNPAYISPQVAANLQSYSKAAIKVKFNKALSDEPNYSQCYGPNNEDWPAPCVDTKDSSTKLSSRCLIKLLTDVGCTNKAIVNADYAATNNLVAKASHIITFTGWASALPDDLTNLAKCYGSDGLSWPDPCANVPDTARLYYGEINKRCFKQMYYNATKCTILDEMQADPILDTYYANITAAPAAFKTYMAFVTKAYLKTAWAKQSQDNPTDCKWTQSTTPSTTTTLSKRIGVEMILGISINNRILLKAPGKDGWFDTGVVGLISVIQLQDGTFAGISGNNDIYTNTRLYDTSWTQIPDSGLIKSLVQLHDGTFLATGSELYPRLYTKSSLVFTNPRDWVQVINSQNPVTIIQLQDKSILGIHIDNGLYKKQWKDTKENLLTFNSTNGWVQTKFAYNPISVAQLNDGSFISVHIDGSFYSKPNIDANWTHLNYGSGFKSTSVVYI
jgi:hypothetical protein